MRQPAIAFIGMILCMPAAAQPRAGHAAKPASPFTMDVVPWSLDPAMGSAEARLGMRAMAPQKPVADPHAAETIVVFGRRRAPTEEALHHDDPEFEAAQSDAARPMVGRMGEGCSYKSGCFDPDQKGLFSMIPGLFGGN